MPMEIEIFVKYFIQDISGESESEDKITELSDIIRRNLGVDQIEDVLGSGSFGAAASLDQDRVLKLTSDPQEVQAATNIWRNFEQGVILQHVARIYGAWYLSNYLIFNQTAKQRTRLGMVILERMDEVKTALDWRVAHSLRDVVERIKFKFKVWPNELQKITRAEARSRLSAAASELIILLESQAKYMLKKDPIDFKEVADQFNQIALGIKELFKLGIYGVDVHPGNIGKSQDGVIKIFDIGVSSSPKTSPRVVKNPDEQPYWESLEDNVPVLENPDGGIESWPRIPISREIAPILELS